MAGNVREKVRHDPVRGGPRPNRTGTRSWMVAMGIEYPRSGSGAALAYEATSEPITPPFR
jgi:hypothetical protein